ncbi:MULTISPECIES: hypothetical protein [unclassified Paludibacterium]|uniref:hypothetical protein n=1 Tax=unclassified Paludibacterium TaxID=2618429 RepID=UPI001C03C9D1|nr:hypothetical protein [Paludibacterium sp. B53371]
MKKFLAFRGLANLLLNQWYIGMVSHVGRSFRPDVEALGEGLQDRQGGWRMCQCLSSRRAAKLPPV